MIVAPSTRGPIDGARLREARWAAGLTQLQLCLRAGLGPRTVAYAENGRASRKTIERLAGVLRVPPHQLAPGLVPNPQPLPPAPLTPLPEFRVAALPPQSQEAGR